MLNVYLCACQGLGERVPSSSVFEVQTSEDKSSFHHTRDLNQPIFAADQPIPTESISPEHLISFQIQLKDDSNRNPTNPLLCQSPDINLAKHIRMTLDSAHLPIIRVQSQLWIETELTSALNSFFNTNEQSLPQYTPFKDHGGLWVLYTPLNAPRQSLFLAKPIPWMSDRARVIAHCSPSELLTKLSFTPLNTNKMIESEHRLTLVSKEAQIENE